MGTPGTHVSNARPFDCAQGRLRAAFFAQEMTDFWRVEKGNQTRFARLAFIVQAEGEDAGDWAAIFVVGGVVYELVVHGGVEVL
jgi:hypothetical protein